MSKIEFVALEELNGLQKGITEIWVNTVKYAESGDTWTNYKISIKSIMQNVQPMPRLLDGPKNIIHGSSIRTRFAWPKTGILPL